MREKGLSFPSTITKLKAIPRSGWISHGISFQDVESVADHSYSTSAIAMLLADIERQGGRRVKIERILRLAILHDLAESLTFDISKSYLEYLGKEGEAIKRKLERAAWTHITKNIPSMRGDYMELMAEFDAEETLESQIVHAADMLDILFQIVEYRRRGYPKAVLGDLWTSTNRRLKGVGLPSVRRLHRIAVRGYRATA